MAEAHRFPVLGSDNKAALEQHYRKLYGEALSWQENPAYVGPTKLSDQKGMSEIRGWFVVAAPAGGVAAKEASKAIHVAVNCKDGEGLIVVIDAVNFADACMMAMRCGVFVGAKDGPLIFIPPHSIQSINEVRTPHEH